ncbi:MAG: hypothetical protein KI788_15825 [Mameliella sp.]|nr:hypothetical protein [Mameliella sp.]
MSLMDILRRGKHAKETVEAESIYAVWKYDSFPYYLCAPVKTILDDGRIEPEGYGGYRFQPVTLLAAAQGREVQIKLDKAQRAYRNCSGALHSQFCSQLRKSLAENGFDDSGNRLRKTGYQGGGFTGIVEKALGGEV